MTDVISVFLGVVLLIRWISGYRYAIRFPVVLWAVFGLVVVWIAREWVFNGTLSNTDPIRWLVAVPYAYALYRFASRTDTRSPLVTGMCIGAAANLVVLAMQAAGATQLAVQLGFASGRWTDVWISGGDESAIRPSGMWGHPNGSAGVIALCFPLVCGLIDEKRLRPLWMVGALAVVFASSAWTFTRSGILVSAAIFVAWTARSLRTGRYARSKLVVASAGLIALVVIGPPGGWWRWAGESNIAENSAGRFDSSFRAMQLACMHPLGVGAEYQTRLAALTETGIEATHDAWLYLALVAGLPLALLLLAGTVRRAWSLLRRSSVEGWVALGVLGLCFFEEFFRVPLFPVIGLWLLMPARELTHAGASAPATAMPASGGGLRPAFARSTSEVRIGHGRSA